MTYDSLGRNRLTSVDARGKTTRYTYDTDKRMLTAVTDPRGYKVNYSYNGDNDQLQTVSSSLGASVSYEYDTGDRISKITHHETAYNFTYDEFGNSKEVKVGEQALVTNSYYPGNGPIEEVEYGNGYTQSFEYDKKYQLTSVSGKEANETTESVLYTNEYDHYGNVTKHIDKENSITYEYQHDLIGRVSGMKSSEGQRIGIKYDDKNRISQLAHKADGTNVTTEYVYGDVDNTAKEHPGLPYGLKIDGTRRSTLEYDALARVKKRTLNLDNGIYEIAYEYAKGKEDWHTTTLAETMLYGSEEWLTYGYDRNGNIGRIESSNGIIGEYRYDKLDRLTIEKDSVNNKLYQYGYNAGGNIESVMIRGCSESKEILYIYGNANWKDQLTKVTIKIDEDEPIEYEISYDGIGNPLNYFGMTMTWKKGRRLASLAKNGKTYQYQYNSKGIRIGKKRLNGTTVENTTKYYLNGNKVMTMDDGTNTVHFIYDQDGKLFATKVGSTMYYYLLNLQGDVIGLIDSSGNEMVSYCYDAWGRLLSTTDNSGVGIGALNPFRYRGYFYDAETGFYYLNKRYYDPEVGRFINADSTGVLLSNPISLSEKNLYSYCNNNPVNNLDLDGRIAVTVNVVWTVVEAATETFMAWRCAKLYDEEFTWADAGVTFATSILGTFGQGITAICAVTSGFVAMNKSLVDGESLGTAILIGGVTALGSYLTMNNVVELMGYGLKGGVSAFSTAMFGTGNILMIEGVSDVVRDTSKKTKKGKSDYYYSDIGYETPDYTIVKNGRLMK